MDKYLLTPEELSTLPNSVWTDGHWVYDPYEIMRRQIAKVLSMLEKERFEKA